MWRPVRIPFRLLVMGSSTPGSFVLLSSCGIQANLWCREAGSMSITRSKGKPTGVVVMWSAGSRAGERRMPIKCNTSMPSVCIPSAVCGSQGFPIVSNWHPRKVDHCNCPHFTEEEIVLHSGKAHLCSVFLCCIPRYFPGVPWGPITNYLKELLRCDDILWNVGLYETKMTSSSCVLSQLA